MPFLKQGKTNWKYIIIVTVLAVLVAGGIFWGEEEQEDIPISLPEIETPEKIEITEQLTDKITDKIVTQYYSQETIKRFFIDDLNNKGSAEIIVGAVPTEIPIVDIPNEAILIVVTPTDEEGSYKKIAEFKFHKEDNISFRNVPCVDDQNDLLDIEGDGIKEMVVNLGTGGASNVAFGVFKIDWEENKIEWLKVKKENGNIGNTNFLRGGSVMHQEMFYLEDLDGDEIMEAIEKMSKYIGTSGDPEDWEKEENWEWEIWVYKWDGSMFVYDEELSNLLLETATWETYRNEEYGYEVKYPEKINKTYIKTQEWPPKVTVGPIDPEFLCKKLQNSNSEQNEITVNDNKYCLFKYWEGAMGARYVTYLYTTTKDDKHLTLEFILGFSSCGAFYGINDKMEECKEEQETFDPDILIDKIVSTFKFFE